MQSLKDLNRQFGIEGHLRFVETSPDFFVAEITNAHATASVALQGAHVMTWRPGDDEPVIWLSDAAKLAPGKSIRGGVPICWPWFGAHSDAGKPAHGYARTVPWHMIETKLLEGGATRLAFGLPESDATRALWPHATPVRVVITVGRELEVELVTRNDENQPVTIGEALHTYFQVSDVDEILIEGLSGTTYADKVENMARKVQQGPISIGGEVDRVYVGTPAECAIVDRGYRRRIRIVKEGSRSTVVWNPWIEKAEKMGDLGDKGYRRMVCVESGNALDDVVHIAPGREHRMKVTYRIEKL